MSKKKNRQDTNYRYCPMCGGKRIFVWIENNIFKSKTFIHCCNCNKDIQVLKHYRKRNLDSIFLDSIF